MKQLLFTLTMLAASAFSYAQDVTIYKLSNDAITADELLAGDLDVALRVWTTTKDMYISDANNRDAFDENGSTVFHVEAAQGGILLKNVKSGEYFGGEGTALARTTDASQAKVFTPVKITSKVGNTHNDADETRSFWLTCEAGGKKYLNTNTGGYTTVQYAGGNGNWSTMYIYKVNSETVKAQTPTCIIPIPKNVTLNGEGILPLTALDNITFQADASLADEAYIIDITTEGISVTSSGDKGKFYAMQSLVQLQEGNTDGLPLLHIEDAPRFAYRGFMLDVSRHFFSVAQVKKMLDIMARYKMNVFHWHLTDDQGWRAEIRKYPKLTTIGAERSDNYDTPITMIEENGQIYWTGNGSKTGQKYGPYFYTQDEMREVVAYAKERQIDILPEVDMPGHFVAAMAAYPEYCCHPNTPPTVWTGGGISGDVLNVANPQAVQFAKDILDELCDIFPYPYIHIGGDECPTSQWESNAECQAKYEELGLSNYRQLQNHFIKEISDFVQTKGKQIICWNEAITSSGADLNIMKETGSVIMSWNPCQEGVSKAVKELGLPAIVTEYHRGNGGYYINRKQSNDYGEPSAAGYGNDSAEGCYNYVPVQGTYTDEQLALIKGVQGTFWTEHVGTREYLEYLALPRLICVAEAGWANQNQKDWENFRSRLLDHTKWLDDNDYIYARHWMPGYVPRQEPRPENEQEATPEVSTVEKPKWYRIKFTAGNTYLQMNGPNLATTAAFQNDKSQYFALIPTSTTSPSINGFRLYSANGYWVTTKAGTATNGQSGTFLCGAENKASGTILCVQQHPSDDSKYVISKTSDKTTGFNTWGGTGVGANIGFWNKSSNSDMLVFTTDDYNAGYEETGDDDTGVSLAPSTPTSDKADIYDLTGRRVAKTDKGLYIVGGSKLIK